MTKHDAVKEYFEPKILELADKNLNFNFSPEAPDSVSIITRYSDKLIRSFITGERRKNTGSRLIS